MKKNGWLLAISVVMASPLLAGTPAQMTPSEPAAKSAPAAKAPAAKEPAAEPAPAPAAAPAPAPAPAETAAETSAPATSGIKVVAIETASSVESREAVNPSASFDSNVEKVYCWTKISAGSAPISIHHVWYADGQKTADVPLNINSASARTWSYKTVWPGSWKVDVTDDAGAVLASKEFTVSKMESTAPATQTQ